MLACTFLLFCCFSTGSSSSAAEEGWPGVDETVIERIAEEAGRPAQSLLPAAEGDALLFLFLMAGTAGGFVAGYAFRALFPPKSSLANDAPRT